MKVLKWAVFLKDVYAGKEVNCPECGGVVKASFYAKETEGQKSGFAVLECQECGERAHFSRVLFPPGVKTEPF